MRILTVLALAGATLVALPASAQTIASYGQWDVVAGRTPDDGSPFCAMTSQTTDGRAFHVVWMERDRDLRLRIRERSWQIRSGEGIPVRIEIDGLYTWTARGRPLEPRLFEVLIANRDIAAWERAWRRGLRMEISFPGSVEPTWRFGLEGTNRATDAFLRCIDQVQGRWQVPPTAVPNSISGHGGGKIF
jgi:hypothetical protein